MSEEKIKDYSKITAAVYTELKELLDSGKVTLKDFNTFNTKEEEIMVTIIPFSNGGFLDTITIKKAIDEIANLRNIDINCAAWLLMFRPCVCSAIYTTIDGIANRNIFGQEVAQEKTGKTVSEEEWENFFSYYLLRTFLKAEFDNF